jgi:hypothetical protein
MRFSTDMTMTTKTTLDRDDVIKAIRAALKRRSGKAWSVKGGRGTGWGWIQIEAPPARRTYGWVLPEGAPDIPDSYRLVDKGQPDGCMGEPDKNELAELLGLERGQVSYQGVSIPASSDYRQEYLDRAEGREPSVIGRPYWD